MPKKQDEISEGDTGEETPQETEPETTPAPEAQPEDEKITLSAKEHNELLRQAKAASDLGRTVKSLSQSHTTLKSSLDEQLKRYSSLEENFNVFKNRDREAELEKYKDDRGMLDVIRLKHKTEDERESVRRERSDFEKERTQHQTRLEAAMKTEATELAKELAAESGLAATTILQIGTDTTDGKTSYNLERMKSIAKSVPKGETEEAEEDGSEEGNSPAVKGQRSRAAGAGGRSAARGLSTLADYYKAYNANTITVEEMAKARERFGVAY